MRRLKNVVIFVQTILSFVLSRKIISKYIWKIIFIWRPVKYSNCNGFNFWHGNLKKKNMFKRVWKNNLRINTQIAFNITCNTSTTSVSIIPNYTEPLIFTSAFIIELSSFDSVMPKIAGLIEFMISLSSSVLDNKLFTFKWQKCKPRVLRGSQVLH